MAAARTLTRAALGRAALPMMMTEQRASPLLLALARSSGAGPRTTETFHKSPHAPSRRGASTSSTAATSDRIHMRGLVFYAYHGVYPEEEKLGQRFDVDVTMDVCLRAAGASDDLQHSVDYGAVYMLVKKVVEGQRRQLIEAVAEDIAREVLQHSAKIGGVAVTVKKPHVAVPGQVDYLGVEIFRNRADDAAAAAANGAGGR